MAICGVAPMPKSPGSIARQSMLRLPRNSSGVVQLCPATLTYWRSSPQIGQVAGGASEGGC